MPELIAVLSISDAFVARFVAANCQPSIKKRKKRKTSVSIGDIMMNEICCKREGIRFHLFFKRSKVWFSR